MNEQIDARGLACPLPVVKAKQAVERGENAFVILVDNEVARQNLMRFAESVGFQTDSAVQADGTIRVQMRRTGEPAAVPAVISCNPEGKWLFIAADKIGHGADELGAKLMLAFLFTLTESDRKPAGIILMQSGVRLATEEPQAVEHLKKLVAGGVKLLVCGTCLDYFKLKERLQVGEVSNMFAIAEKLLAAHCLTI